MSSMKEFDNSPFNLDCPGPEDLNTIYRNFSPYLYPFIIEFCILIVGIFYMMWANINRCPKKLSASGHHGHHGHSSPSGSHNHNGGLGTHIYPSLGSIPEETDKETDLAGNDAAVPRAPPSEISEHCKNTAEHENEYKSNIVVHADCHAASRGLFCKNFRIFN